MEKATFKGKLITFCKDCGYITYVFELLDEEDKSRLQTKYIMCVRYPNWNSPQIDINEIGIVEVLEVRAGIDKYFKDNNMIPYKYNNIQFMKFIPFKVSIDNKITLD